jgi:hypothetical protein
VYQGRSVVWSFVYEGSEVTVASFVECVKADIFEKRRFGHELLMLEQVLSFVPYIAFKAVGKQAARL